MDLNYLQYGSCVLDLLLIFICFVILSLICCNLQTTDYKSSADIKGGASQQKPHIYYHGSPINIKSEILPQSSHVLDGEKAVFATNKRIIAAIFISPWGDDEIQFSIKNGMIILKEMKAGAFDLLKMPGYIFHVDAEGFETDPRLGLQNYEFVTKKSVKILKSEKIENIYSMLTKSDEVRLINKSNSA